MISTTAFMDGMRAVLTQDFLAFQSASAGSSGPENPGIQTPKSINGSALKPSVLGFLPRLWHRAGQIEGLAQWVPVARARRAYEDWIREGLAQRFVEREDVHDTHQDHLLGAALQQLGSDHVSELTLAIMGAHVIGEDFRSRAFHRLGEVGLPALVHSASVDRDETAARILNQFLTGADHEMRASSAREVLRTLENSGRPLPNLNYPLAIHEYVEAHPTYYPADTLLIEIAERRLFVLSGLDSVIRSEDVIFLMICVESIISSEQHELPVRQRAIQVFTDLLSGHFALFSECAEVFSCISPLARLIFLRVVHRHSVKNGSLTMTEIAGKRVAFYQFYFQELWPLVNVQPVDSDVRHATLLLQNARFDDLDRFLETQIAEKLG